MSSPRAHASRSLAMRPRTIAKHELVGMGSTSSQMSKRDWKPLRSPRNQKTQPADVEPPMRSPRPRNQAKAETTASLIMVNGNSMVKTYRLVSDMQRENAERPSMEGGSVLTMAHLQKLCSLYAQLCEDDMRGMVTLEQLTAIVRGALGMEEERFTPRIFRVADPRGSGRIDFPRFFVELMMPVSVTGLVKLHYIFTSLSINPRDHEGTLPSVARGEIEGILGYAAKVQQYYLQWADEVFASMEGYPIAGLSSRHRCILKRDLEAATARQPLLSICLGKCLETERHIVESLTNVQDQTNELVKLANMGITSMMETTSLTTAEQPIFTFENLQQLWVHFKEKLDYQGPEKQTEKPAPILEHDQFVDIMDSFFPDGTTKQVTRGGFVSVQAIDPQVRRLPCVYCACLCQRDSWLSVPNARMETGGAEGSCEARSPPTDRSPFRFGGQNERLAACRFA